MVLFNNELQLFRQRRVLKKHRNRPPIYGVYLAVEDLCLDLKQIFVRFRSVAMAASLLLIPLFSMGSVSAQDGAKDPKSEYKSSLTTLSDLYKTEVQRLEKHQQQSKELYDGGLISRLEYESGEKALGEARAKVDEVEKQIVLANQPAPVLPPIVGLEMTNINTVWSTGSAKIDNIIRYYGNLYKVDPYLIFCTMSQESKFSSGATSYKGAMGLMQLMPDTAARYGVTNPYDVSQSIMGGTRYLKDLLKMFNGRVDLALAGYNAGEGAVMKYGYTVPPYDETRNYVRLILARYGKKQAS